MKEGTFNFFVNPKECGAANSKVNYAHHRAAVQAADALLTHYFLKHCHSRWRLFLDRVDHQTRLKHIEGCHSEAGE